MKGSISLPFVVIVAVLVASRPIELAVKRAEPLAGNSSASLASGQTSNTVDLVQSGKPTSAGASSELNNLEGSLGIENNIKKHVSAMKANVVGLSMRLNKGLERSIKVSNPPDFHKDLSSFGSALRDGLGPDFQSSLVSSGNGHAKAIEKIGGAVQSGLTSGPGSLGQMIKVSALQGSSPVLIPRPSVASVQSFSGTPLPVQTARPFAAFLVSKYKSLISSSISSHLASVSSIPGLSPVSFLSAAPAVTASAAEQRFSILPEGMARVASSATSSSTFRAVSHLPSSAPPVIVRLASPSAMSVSRSVGAVASSVARVVPPAANPTTVKQAVSVSAQAVAASSVRASVTPSDPDDDPDDVPSLSSSNINPATSALKPASQVRVVSPVPVPRPSTIVRPSVTLSVSKPSSIVRLPTVHPSAVSIAAVPVKQSSTIVRSSLALVVSKPSPIVRLSTVRPSAVSIGAVPLIQPIRSLAIGTTRASAAPAKPIGKPLKVSTPLPGPRLPTPSEPDEAEENDDEAPQVQPVKLTTPASSVHGSPSIRATRSVGINSVMETGAPFVKMRNPASAPIPMSRAPTPVRLSASAILSSVVEVSIQVAKPARPSPSSSAAAVIRPLPVSRPAHIVAPPPTRPIPSVAADVSVKVPHSSLDAPAATAAVVSTHSSPAPNVVLPAAPPVAPSPLDGLLGTPLDIPLEVGVVTNADIGVSLGQGNARKKASAGGIGMKANAIQDADVQNGINASPGRDMNVDLGGVTRGVGLGLF